MQRRYTLRPRWGSLILAVLFFTACAALFVYLAATSDRGLVINGILHLAPGGARIFHGVLAALSLGMVAMGVFSMVRLAGGKLHVDIDDDSITLPGKPTRPRPHRFMFAEIQRAWISRVSGQVFLTIQDAHAKSWLVKSHLADGEFDEVVAVVASHVPPPRAELPVAKLR